MRMLADVAGVVVEVGAGNGLNFKHYPAAVTRVVAVEPDPYMREKAQGRATPVVELVDGDAYSLPLGDGEADTVVFSLVLCTIPDPGRALAEARRVLKPGGVIRFYEHVVSQKPWFARLQRAATPVWKRMAGGCEVHRDTAAAIERAGFEVERLERFSFAPAVLAAPHILGSARRGGGGP